MAESTAETWAHTYHSEATTMAYNILSLATNELVLDESTGEPLSFETGALAAERAKALMAANPESGKYQPRVAPSVDDEFWREREMRRFKDGTYTTPDDSLLHWCIPEHFVHVSRDKPEMLAYTENAAKGRADIQRRRRVVSYLEEFAPALTKAQREDIAAEHAAAFSVGIKFAKTPDEIEAVYTDYAREAIGVSDSCMRYRGNHWGNRPHPVRVYGNSDLQVAYLTNERGQTTHRALIWPEKKVYSRVYGDSSSFHAALKACGYQKSSGYYTSSRGAPSLRGARIRALPLDDDGDYDGRYLMPYIDEVGSVGLSSDGKWFILGEEGYDCNQTDGMTQDEDRVCCEHCGDLVDQEDTRTVYTSVRPNGYGRAAETWCECCCGQETFYCEGVNEMFSDDVDHEMADNGRTYTEAYLSRYANLCQKLGTWTFDDLAAVITDASTGNTENWCDDAVASDAFQCRVTGQLYSHSCAKEGTLTRGVMTPSGTAWRGISEGATDEDEDAATIVAA